MRRLLAAALAPILATSMACASFSQRMEPYTEQSTVHELYASAQADDLLLLNGNTWGVPLFARNKVVRFYAARKYVESLPELPDVITFQEVWLQKQVARYREAYPEYVLYASGETNKLLFYNFNSSGLVTLVKKELAVHDVSYTPLDKEFVLSLEAFLGKGALSVSLEHEGNQYTITNIHLPNTHKDMRLGKTQGALEWLQPDGILAGDFNLEPHELPAWLVARDDTPTYKSFKKVRKRRLDYVFPDALSSVESVILTDVHGHCPPLSDHCYVAALVRKKPSAEEVRIAENIFPFEVQSSAK